MISRIKPSFLATYIPVSVYINTLLLSRARCDSFIFITLMNRWSANARRRIRFLYLLLMMMMIHIDICIIPAAKKRFSGWLSSMGMLRESAGRCATRNIGNFDILNASYRLIKMLIIVR